MKPNKKEEANKKLLAVVAEYCELNKVTRNTPWVKLDKPIQTGWTKHHKLREDCSVRSDAAIFKTILKEIDVPIFCRKQDFMDRKGIVMNAGLRVIRENTWDKLGWPESYKKYFLFGTYLVEWHYETNSVPTFYSMKKQIVGYKIKQEFYFEEAIKPYFVTHRQPILPEVESRQKELSAYIDNNGGWTKYEHIKRGSAYQSRDWSNYNSEWLNKDDEIYCIEEEIYCIEEEIY